MTRRLTQALVVALPQESRKFNKDALEKEIAILKCISHEHCMRLYGVYDEPHVTRYTFFFGTHFFFHCTASLMSRTYYETSCVCVCVAVNRYQQGRFRLLRSDLPFFLLIAQRVYACVPACVVRAVCVVV